MKKLSVAIVRGKFLNAYEMQSFAPLGDRFSLTAFGSLSPYHERFDFPVKKLLSPMDIPEIPYKMPVLNRLFTDAHVLFGLENALKGFDLVHTAETYYYYTHQSLIAKKKGYVKKVIATVLENIPFNNEGIWGRKALKEYARENLDHMIALTGKTKQALLLEGADERKITVIGHGIDTRRFSPRAHHLETLRERKSDIRILFSGRLETYKGIYDVLSAFRELVRDPKHRFSLTFVGDGSERQKLMRLTREYDLKRSVTFRRVSYDTMPSLYRSHDIFVAPSVSTPTWEEQYCTVLLEAQSMGMPIVTTRSGGIPENVGDTAMFVLEHDPKGIALAIKRFSDSPSVRIDFGRRARARAVKVHDVHVIAEKIASVYDRILSAS